MTSDRTNDPHGHGPPFGVDVPQLPMGSYVNAVTDEVRTVHVSPQLELMLGWTLEEWAQHGFFESVIHPNDREAVMALVEEFHRTGERFSVEYRIHAKDGRVRWVHDETVVVHDDAGRPAFLQGFVLDITEHRRRTALVAGQRSVLELIARGEPLARVIDEVSRGLAELLDGAAVRVELNDPERPPASRTDDPWTVELPSVGDRLGRLVVTPVAPGEPGPEQRRILDAVAYAVSIAVERARDEQSLREAEAKYRTLVERLPIGTYINSFGTRLRPLYVSPELVGMLGYDLEEWNEADFLSGIIHPDDRERVLEQVVRTHELAVPFADDYRLRGADGRWVWVHDETIPVLDDDGNRLFLQGFMLDITERKHLEEQLLHAQKLEAVGRLAGGIAHDFNNVLTAISGYAEFLIARLSEGDPRRADAEEIVRAADRAAALTRQLLAFSRRQVLQPRELDLNAAIGNLERLLGRLAGDDVELTTELEPNLVVVRADPGQIEQVILNLAVNARDAMDDGGRLVLKTQTVVVELGDERLELDPGRYAALTVADTGQGIADEIRPFLFEPFFTTKEQGKGTGLGLASVYGIVKQSGGNVRVESAPGEGAAFTVYLPEAAAAVSVLATADEVPPEGDGETVLLVEDHELFRGLVKEVLSRAGYLVLEAESGAEGLRLLEETGGRVDLVLTDVVMPGMSGVDLARRVHERHPEMPVVYTSAYAPEDRLAGEVPAAAPFIGKPFVPTELVGAVRAAMGKAER
jgi:two-component system cell cycle sensor histidine kinase/response regulator CckA